MKNLYTSIIVLLCLNLSAQNWQTISTDVSGDGATAGLLDGTDFSYWYNASTDSLWFRVTTSNLNGTNSQAMGVNIMVNIPGGSQTFNFWGSSNTDPYHFLLTAWVTGSAPSAYSGTIGVANATGVSGQNYTNSSHNNLTIRVDIASKTIVVGLLRDDLIPDALFSGNSITVKTAAAVGSNQFWNDDIYSSNGSMTLTKSNNVSLDEDFSVTLQLYPNPSTGRVMLSGISSEASYNIVDVSGKRILSGQYIPGEAIDVSHLDKGIYLIQIEAESLRFQLK